MKQYSHLFFDLDHTLWDFEKNSAETLTDICRLFKLDEDHGIMPADFVASYSKINRQMWRLFRENKISKDEMRIVRFKQALEGFSVKNDALSREIGHYYVETCPHKPHLIEGAIEVLETLRERYEVHLLTNGFTLTQNKKIDGTGIRHYFKNILIAEEVGFKKPQPEMYERALSLSGADKTESIMIGDDYEADVLGARMAGIDQVHFNPDEFRSEVLPTHDIRHLRQLIEIF